MDIHHQKLKKVIVDLKGELKRLDRKYSAHYAAMVKKIYLGASQNAIQAKEQAIGCRLVGKNPANGK